MAFDGIVTKAIATELQQLVGAKIDQIYEPNKNTLLFGLYHQGNRYSLAICCDAQNYRMHLTTHPKPNPKVAPNFCMVLRKYLLGFRIVNFITNDLERIVTVELEGFDDVDDIVRLKLIIELMGKHCNILLVDEENTIIDSLRHIREKETEDSSRNIYPHQTYHYPTTNKKNLLTIENAEQFEKELIGPLSSPSSSHTSSISSPVSTTPLGSVPSEICFADLPKQIGNTFNGISQSLIRSLLKKYQLNENDPLILRNLYSILSQLVEQIDTAKVQFEVTYNAEGKATDYYLIPENDTNSSRFSLNFFLDDFYYQKESSEELKNTRNSILKLMLSILKKYQKRLLHMNEKLQECEHMDQFRIYGELLTAHLYQWNQEKYESVQVTNYYDQNKLLTIPLDKRYTPSENAKRYFKKYHKLKNTLAIVSNQKEDTLKELSYLESIVYELENSQTLEEISTIFEEISENVIFEEKVKGLSNKKTKMKKSKLTKNKTVSFNPIKYTIDGYSILVGRNNRENDWLTLKYAKKTDLWFHTQEIHGSHVILKLPENAKVSQDLLIQVAEIAALHSKGKSSSHVPVDYCEVKYVKKPSGAKPGMVIYTHQQTLSVNPKMSN